LSFKNVKSAYINKNQMQQVFWLAPPCRGAFPAKEASGIRYRAVFGPKRAGAYSSGNCAGLSPDFPFLHLQRKDTLFFKNN